MILPAQRIRRRCIQVDYGDGMALPDALLYRSIGPLIEPFCERTIIDGLSYGLGIASYDVRIAQRVTLYPGDFTLASTMERFNIHPDLCAIVHDKSSWARRGIAVQNTLFDPGWRGFATLELSNHGDEYIEIAEGWPVAQIVFHKLTEEPERLYSGKYQDQQPGPQPSRLENEKSPG